MKLLYVIVCAFVLESSRALINRNLKYQDNWRWIVYPRPRHVSVNDTRPTEEEKVRVRRNPNWGYQPNWRWIAYARSGDVSVNDTKPKEEEQKTRVRRNLNRSYQPNWRWIAYPRPRHVSVNDTHPTEEEKVRVRRNPNWGYQPNWRWIAYARSGDVSVNDTKPKEEEQKTRVRRNPNRSYQPNWRWIAYARSGDVSVNDTKPKEEEKVRVRRNPNRSYQPNWRWIAYPRPRHVSVDDTQPKEEEKARMRRNPNRGYQPNWRWIAYARSGDVSVNDIQHKEEAKQQTTPNPVSVLTTIEMYKNHQHAKPKTDEVDHEKYDLQFNRSLYQGWYQTPASLTVKNTLLFGGPWGSSNQTDHDDTINTCNIAEITMCNDDNNIPGESRQCFRNSDSITSYAMHLFNVTADNVQVLKIDEKAAQLPFPNAFNVTISSVNHINGCDGNPIVCHSMMTNSSECDTVYLCHSVKGTTVEQVTVDFNDQVNGVKLYAMCHMDTHNFGKEHVAFRMLQKHPGDSICHFISPNSFLVCKT